MGLAVSLVTVISISGCGFGPASVLFTFENQTGLALCDFHTTHEAAEADCLAEIKPHGTTKWGRDCDNLRDRPIRMVIAVKESRRVIYDRTATCGEWNHRGTIVIRAAGSEFVVTDELSP
jgi:hypothetical protein